MLSPNITLTDEQWVCTYTIQELYTIRDAARITGVSARYIRDATLAGTISDIPLADEPIAHDLLVKWLAERDRKRARARIRQQALEILEGAVADLGDG